MWLRKKNKGFLNSFPIELALGTDSETVHFSVSTFGFPVTVFTWHLMNKSHENTNTAVSFGYHPSASSIRNMTSLQALILLQKSV